MKIIRLEAENVKRLRAVEIRPDPENNLVVISGKNSQGKTSVLDSILYALGGTRAIQEQPIRKGEKVARTLVELDDFVVERKWTSNERSYLTVKPKGQDVKMSSPQKVLDELVGELSFDPLKFSRMAPREQRQLLIDLADFDFGKLEERLEEARRQRSAARLAKDRALAKANELVKPELENPEPVDVSEIMDKIRSGRQQNEGLAQTKRDRDLCVAKVNELDDLRNLCVAKVNELDAEIERLAESREAVAGEAERLTKTLETLVEVDVSAYEEQIERVQGHNDQVNELRRWEEAQRAAKEEAENYDGMKAQVEKFEAEKRRKIAESNLPVSGLGFNDQGVTFNDLPFDQLGSAEQLRVSLGMAMALNPKARVIRILDGSLLDQQSLAIVREMADDKDYQIWVEVVDESGQMGVVIEDGTVKVLEGEGVPS